MTHADLLAAFHDLHKDVTAYIDLELTFWDQPDARKEDRARAWNHMLGSNWRVGQELEAAAARRPKGEKP